MRGVPISFIGLWPQREKSAPNPHCTDTPPAQEKRRGARQQPLNKRRQGVRCLVPLGHKQASTLKPVHRWARKRLLWRLAATKEMRASVATVEGQARGLEPLCCWPEGSDPVELSIAFWEAWM
ncbi:hypothetical protein NDU88_001574 [Pleurodeles waltl]|uniref:Uncharacterized protein n=1 Tax=Pleurodeles waltl TaxID=8319 RepID=A0AAV7Q6E7_PLEWA|nr:hypothetical protein NDU88_001574 [Pleurodeles waltl]